MSVCRFQSVLAVAITLTVGWHIGPAWAGPPNFILFLADDLGYGDLGCYGSPINRTPNLDQFASQGVQLTDCHSAGTICSPSRAGLLTGRHPYRLGFTYLTNKTSFLRSEEVTLAEVLKERGYQTAFFGKWHLSLLDDADQPDPGQQGFDDWLATTLNAFEGPENPLHFVRNGKKTGKLEGWYCDILVRESLAWLKKIDPDKPFFLFVSLHEPHTPLAPPDSLAKEFRQPELLKRIEDQNYGGVKRDNRAEIEQAANYFGTIKQLDDAFGKFISTFDETQHKDNTLVFFTSDNGPEHPVNFEESKGEWEDPIRDNCYGTPGPFRGMKRFPYEGGHRVPGLIRWPALLPAGIESNQLVNGTDFLPTVVQLVGAKPFTDRPLDGASVLGAFAGSPVKRASPPLWMFPIHGDSYTRMPHLAIREGRYSLLGWFPDKRADESLSEWAGRSTPKRFELFDLLKDPGQSNDLAASEPQLTLELSQAMTKKWIEMRDSHRTP